MKHYYYLLLLVAICTAGHMNAQVAGDTIVVPTFNYKQTSRSGIRDTMINFPNKSGLTFEKIYMLYNMRCKGGVKGNLVTPSGTTGCGEWDYSCNTYIVDSSKYDSTKATHADYSISGFPPNPYKYTNKPTYTYYKYTQQNVANASVISEAVATVGAGAKTSSAPFNASNRTSKSQFLWTASELTNAGFVAGKITGLKLNIANLGSGLQYLKINLKSTSDTFLDASKPHLKGFTEVYFSNTTLVAGANQLNFYKNFAWNGTDNIIVEFNFTNAVGGLDNIVLSDSTSKVSGLISSNSDYNFEFTGSNLLAVSNTDFSSINKEITISFWGNGNPNFLPINGTLLLATNAKRDRQLNIHLPWSNGSIYWDNGSNGSYDRIFKATDSSAQYMGKWNHYAFTKNTTSGVVKIYINGSIWLTGTGKTIPMIVNQLFLGAHPDNVNPYFGKIDEFSIWNKELSQATIQAWMYKNITVSHPDYANLLAYYHYNEGSGSVCNDVINAAAKFSVTKGFPVWNLFRGNEIFKGFTESTNRPMVTFVNGTYTQTISPISIIDSIQNIANMVYHFGLKGSDIVSLDTNIYYASGDVYTYDVLTGKIVDTTKIASIGTINVSQLNYFSKSPSRFQIMSFVTPYGNGLDLGVNGKTWTFDVTDFTPFLKGPKRIQMDAGGQWQEDMDIKFMFIVGTPPRNVLDINNLWKVESVPYTNILNDTKFEPKKMTMDAAAKAFKLRSMITGHGQEGEFITQTHFLP